MQFGSFLKTVDYNLRRSLCQQMSDSLAGSGHLRTNQLRHQPWLSITVNHNHRLRPVSTMTVTQFIDYFPSLVPWFLILRI